MRLVDVNVLVYAFRADADHHVAVRGWLEHMLTTDEAYAVSDHVLAGFLRVVTHPRIFRRPASIGDALTFIDAFRDRPNAVVIQPGARHWSIFERLCRETNATGNLVPDAWLGALAIEHGCEFVSSDRDFRRFAELRLLDPTAP